MMGVQIWGSDWSDRLFALPLAILYAVIYIPRAFQPLPSDYRPAVQENMAYVAETVARGTNPYSPPYPSFYSTAGGHLHGVVGAPFELFVDAAAASRFGVLTMGFGSLLTFYAVLRELGLRRITASTTVSLLAVYPQYILFHSAGNPSAADSFFSLVAVFGYLRWRSEQASRWLALSVAASGAAVFSHFYAGVVAVGLLTHYALTTRQENYERVRTAVAYGLGMVPAGALLVVYKFIYRSADPNSHYFDRLLYNSFDSLYATKRIYGSAFGVFSNQFVFEVLREHQGKSPLFGEWWVAALAGVVLLLGWRATPSGQRDTLLFVSTWIGAGSLTVFLIPGGVIYHDYYTWWLLLGVFAGLGWSFETLLPLNPGNYDLGDKILLSFSALLAGCLLWLSFTSRWIVLYS